MVGNYWHDSSNMKSKICKSWKQTTRNTKCDMLDVILDNPIDIPALSREHLVGHRVGPWVGLSNLVGFSNLSLLMMILTSPLSTFFLLEHPPFPSFPRGWCGHLCMSYTQCLSFGSNLKVDRIHLNTCDVRVPWQYSQGHEMTLGCFAPYPPYLEKSRPRL